MKLCLFYFWLLVAALSLGAGTPPFSFFLAKEGDAPPKLTLNCEVRKDVHIFADLKVFTNRFSAPLKFENLPETKKDETGRDYFSGNFSLAFASPSEGEKVFVEFMYCDATTCFPPQTIAVTEKGWEEVAALPAAPSKKLPVFSEISRAYGYMNETRFLAFLAGEKEKEISRAGLLGLLLIFAGGFLLNLTPCVLPMIPLTLAVLGASRGKASAKRGAFLGSLYGLGLALTYGGLGALAIALGGAFGEWNNLWYFRLALALLFVLLGLSLFDLFLIDWSRFVGQPKALKEKRGSAIGAFFLGILTALVAGACVAPVLIYCLAQGAALYSDGNKAGLFLPFVLGLGLAAPWPFLGAGLSFLPKPGAWMVYLKKGLGVVLILIGLYYVWSVPALYRGIKEVAPEKVEGYFDNNSAALALATAKAEKKPLVVDFGASWCRACHLMDQTTLQKTEVKKALCENFVFLRYQTDAPFADARLKENLDSLKPKGYPAFIILKVL